MPKRTLEKPKSLYTTHLAINLKNSFLGWSKNKKDVNRHRSLTANQVPPSNLHHVSIQTVYVQNGRKPLSCLFCG